MLKITTLALLILGLSACGSNAATPESNRAVVVEADGSYSFYAGRGVGDAVASGRSVGMDYPHGFMALKVPASLYEEATQAPQKVKTVSLEVPDPSIEMIVHPDPASAVPDTLYFHPGDPWVTGYAQVGVGTDNFTMGYFEVIKWNKDTTGTMPTLYSEDIYTTGLLPDDTKPALQYADGPKDPLPSNWM
jgi:hypothetical protein